MNTYLIMGIATVAVAGGILLVFKEKPNWIKKVFKKKTTLLDTLFKKKLKIECETVSIEGSLNFLEVVNWFKTLKLDKNKHVPFVAKASAMKSVLSIQPTKKESLFVGVYEEEKDLIVHAKLIEADELDAKTREVLGNEDLIVLS